MKIEVAVFDLTEASLPGPSSDTNPQVLVDTRRLGVGSEDLVWGALCASPLLVFPAAEHLSSPARGTLLSVPLFRVTIPQDALLSKAVAQVSLAGGVQLASHLASSGGCIVMLYRIEPKNPVVAGSVTAMSYGFAIGKSSAVSGGGLAGG